MRLFVGFVMQGHICSVLCVWTVVRFKTQDFSPNPIVNNRHKLFAQPAVCYARMTLSLLPEEFSPSVNGRKKDWFLDVNGPIDSDWKGETTANCLWTGYFPATLWLFSHESKVRNLNDHLNCAFWITQCTHERSNCDLNYAVYTQETEFGGFSIPEREKNVWVPCQSNMHGARISCASAHVYAAHGI